MTCNRAGLLDEATGRAHDAAHRVDLSDGSERIEHLRTLGHEVPDRATYEDIAELFGWSDDV